MNKTKVIVDYLGGRAATNSLYDFVKSRVAFDWFYQVLFDADRMKVTKAQEKELNEFLEEIKGYTYSVWDGDTNTQVSKPGSFKNIHIEGLPAHYYVYWHELEKFVYKLPR